MASLPNLYFQSQIPDEFLIACIMQIHASISKLASLRPSKQVNNLFSHLVKLCTLPSSIDIKALPKEVQQMRRSLINLCGRAEGLLELEFSKAFKQNPKPLIYLNRFPYYENYVKLAELEYGTLIESGVVQLKKVAFVGSGPLPLTSIILASQHMKSTYFDNFDIDEAANEMARRIVSLDAEIEKRMKFLTYDIMEVKEKLGEYDCIFLAALVGSEEEKAKIIGHIRKYMKDGGVLLVRSAKGARAFLYPVVEEHDLFDFKVLSIFHPTNDVINSVVLLQLQKKPPKLVLKDKDHTSVSLLQENRQRSPSHPLQNKLLQRASSNSSYLFNGNSCPCDQFQAIDASKRVKIIDNKKKGMAKTALEEASSSSQANTSNFQSAQRTEIESSSRVLTFADNRGEKRAKVEHLIPLIAKAEKVIPKSHAADAEKISLSTTWDIALANLLRVAFLLELHRPLAMKNFDAYKQMEQKLELAQKQVTELSENIRSEQNKNRQLRDCILQLTKTLQAEETRRFEVESELKTLKQKVEDVELIKAPNDY